MKFHIIIISLKIEKCILIKSIGIPTNCYIVFFQNIIPQVIDVFTMFLRFSFLLFFVNYWNIYLRSIPKIILHGNIYIVSIAFFWFDNSLVYIRFEHTQIKIALIKSFLVPI